MKSHRSSKLNCHWIDPSNTHCDDCPIWLHVPRLAVGLAARRNSAIVKCVSAVLLDALIASRRCCFTRAPVKRTRLRRLR